MNENETLAIASNQKRITAFVIDDIVIALLILIIFFDQLMEISTHLPSVITPESIEVLKSEMNQFSVQNLIFIISLKLMYHTFFVWQNGMTLGKYFMKIRVVELQTDKTPDLLKSFLRACLRIVSEVLFYVGFVLAFLLPMKQTFHDKFSKCVVVDV